MDHPELTSIINQLSYFTNNKLVKFNLGATESEIHNAETTLGCDFSPEMKMFLIKYNGGRIIETSLQGVQTLRKEKIKKGYDITVAFQYSQGIPEWEKNLIVIGEDLFGNYYVFDKNKVSDNNEHPIYLVDHEIIGDADSKQFFADSYFSFLERVISEMIGVYCADGSMK